MIARSLGSMISRKSATHLGPRSSTDLNLERILASPSITSRYEAGHANRDPVPTTTRESPLDHHLHLIREDQLATPRLTGSRILNTLSSVPGAGTTILPGEQVDLNYNLVAGLKADGPEKAEGLTGILSVPPDSEPSQDRPVRRECA